MAIRTLLPRLLALLLPLALLAVGSSQFRREEGTSGLARQFDRRLNYSRPEVVVLGSSLARTNVLPAKLAGELGIPERRVALLTLPNATAAHWYAVLRNRVFANGHEPKLVLVVSALTTMVTADVLMESNVDRLVNQLTEDEPVIARKVFGTDDPSHFQWLFARERAAAYRQDALEGWRDRVLGLTRPFHAGPSAAALADRANAVVFADERMNYALYDRGGTTGMYGGSVEQLDLSGLDVEADSLLPDIADLVASNGAKLYFVRSPFPPSNADNDFVPPAIEDAALRTIAAHDAGYLDMRSLQLGEEFFVDMRHMSRDGARLFTEALGQTLVDLGAMKKKGKASVQVGAVPARIVRTETPAGLTRPATAPKEVGKCGWVVDVPQLRPIDDAALRRIGHPLASPLVVSHQDAPLPWLPEVASGCQVGAGFPALGLRAALPRAADPSELSLALSDEVPMHLVGEAPAWWVYPGTTLRFSFDQPWSGGPFDVAVRAHALGGEAAPALTVGATTRTLEVVDGRVVLDETLEAPAGKGGKKWTLEVSSPADGPFVLLQNLAIGRAPRTAHLVGQPDGLVGASVRVIGGKVEDTELDPIFRSPPPDVVGKVKPRPVAGELAQVALPAFRALADARHSRVKVPHKCSPFRVLEDGEPLPLPHENCFDVAKLRGGRSCHAGNLLYFASTDGQAPVRSDHTYDVVLDPSRVCERKNQADLAPIRGALWAYPGDVVELTFPSEALGAFYDGANHLAIDLESPDYADGDVLDVDLLVRGKVWQSWSIPARARRQEHEVFLTEALPARTRDVRLVVKNRSRKAWWLLMRVTLAERQPGDAPGAASGPDDEVFDTDLGGDTDVPEDDVLPGDDPFGLVGRDPAEPRPVDAAARAGGRPDMPEPKYVRNTRGGIVEVHVFSLWPLSDPVLHRAGFGPWSPIRVEAAGEVLTHVDGKSSFLGKACASCFVHLGHSLVTRPAEPTEDVRFGLHDDVPISTPDGARAWWAYPGGTVTWSFDGGWPDAAQAGETARLEIAFHAFQRDQVEASTPPEVVVGDGRWPLEVSESGWSLDVDVPVSDLGAITLAVPADGPYALVTHLVVEDALGRWDLLAPGDVPDAD